MKIFSMFILIAVITLSCISSAGTPTIAVENNSEIPGFGFLNRIPGLWHGPVFSDTPAGSFDNWYVDFRPVSSSQVSQYSSLDHDTINYMSFFIVEHGGTLKLAQRTEGVFMGKGCVTYEVMEWADEEKGIYRFSDFQAGSNRAYTEYTFSKNKMIMEAYTNKFNKQKELTLHTRWEAVLADRSEADKAAEILNYPRKKAVMDFSSIFINMPESIYFDLGKDPYPSSTQPYVGSFTVNINIDKSLTLKDSDELFVLLTTVSLFDGLKYIEKNLDYISRYMYLPVNVRTCTINNIHPGTYYLYSFNDVNGDKRHLSGDYMSSDMENLITINPETEVTVNTLIDFVIP